MRLLFLSVALFISISACARTQTPLSRTQANLLGTVCTVTLYGGGKEADLDAAFSRLKAIQDEMSVDIPTSDVSAVNQAAGEHAVKVSQDTFTVISEGLVFSRKGDGAFDITVGPLVKLWGIGTDKAHIPPESQIKATLPLLGWRDVVLDEANRTVFLTRRGMALDLGAIAKGFAADAVARVLQGRGIAHALIDLGGNILTVGLKLDGSRWRIGIQDPLKTRGEYLGILEAGQTSVVTSGVYERFFIKDGVRYHHILDTKTGSPVRNGLLSVSIITPNSMIADGYSTLIFALGLEKGSALLQKEGVGGIFVMEDHQVYVTPDLRGVFTLTSKDYRLMKGR